MTLQDRIQSYLGNGGLFNPEMMEHDKVRNLIIDCRTALASNRETLKEVSTCLNCMTLDKAGSGNRNHRDRALHLVATALGGAEADQQVQDMYDGAAMEPRADIWAPV